MSTMKAAIVHAVIVCDSTYDGYLCSTKAAVIHPMKASIVHTINRGSVYDDSMYDGA